MAYILHGKVLLSSVDCVLNLWHNSKLFLWLFSSTCSPNLGLICYCTGTCKAWHTISALWVDVVGVTLDLNPSSDTPIQPSSPHTAPVPPLRPNSELGGLCFWFRNSCWVSLKYSMSMIFHTKRRYTCIFGQHVVKHSDVWKSYIIDWILVMLT